MGTKFHLLQNVIYQVLFRGAYRVDLHEKTRTPLTPSRLWDGFQNGIKCIILAKNVTCVQIKAIFEYARAVVPNPRSVDRYRSVDQMVPGRRPPISLKLN
jgi:hypothetical protein